MVAWDSAHAQRRLMKPFGLTKQINLQIQQKTHSPCGIWDLFSAESLQQYIEINSSCNKCNEKLRLQAYNNAYKQGMADLQSYFIQKCHVKRSIEDKYNEFFASHEVIDSTEAESPSQISRLIVADNVSTSSLALIAESQLSVRNVMKENILNQYIAKTKKEIMRKAINQNTLQSTTCLFLVVTKQEWAWLMLI